MGSAAFGAVYPWAYWVLAGMAVSAGLAGLFGTDRKLWGASRMDNCGVSAGASCSA